MSTGCDPDDRSEEAFAPERVLADLAERFCQELLGGRNPDLEQYVAQNPELAGEIRDLFPALRLLERAGGGEVARSRAGTLPAIALAPGAGSEQDFVAALVERLAGRELQGGRYERGTPVGRGGQAEVIEAWDSDLRRTVAMKIALASAALRGEGSSDRRSLGRFLEEAQVTAQLEHPGIVPVHELGLDEQGNVYFTMKLVKGHDLRTVFERVRRGDREWTRTRVLGVLMKICEAMAYAHAKGVIHRDLKPSNVMVGKYGEVYVMDWGLARVQDSKDHRDLRIRPPLTSELTSARHRPDGIDSPLVTMDGDVVGTPAFMSPEQARGELAAMGPHSDVYAVGAMLYQLLTGEMPYVPTGACLSNRAVWAQVQRGPPAPLHELAPRVPAELAAICEKAMARDVSARYSNMGALAEDLRAYLEDQVVGAFETGALAELRKWVKRNRPLAGALAAVFVAVLGGLAASLVFKGRADTYAASVLRLSALQELEDLIGEADRLWPATPDKLDAFQEWTWDAERLVAALPGHLAQLAVLRAKALPRTEQEAAEQRAAHPRVGELERERKHIAFLRGLAAARDASEKRRDPAPEEVGLDLAVLSTRAVDVNELAWPLVVPDRATWGEEAKGLVLARHALSLAADGPAAERAEIRDTLAWALFSTGRFEEALAEEAQALEEAGADSVGFRTYYANLERAIEAHSGVEGARLITELEERIEALELEVDTRTGWTFADGRDLWWHNQLVKLIQGLEALGDPDTGLLTNGTSPDHGWGMKRRLAYARTIAARTLENPDASALWEEACASIADPVSCPAYGGLRIAPQLGLLPVGRDVTSGLWEFAHFETGEPAVRDADGRLELEESTGLVLVLLPGGPFWMGAQPTDPGGPNYDPQAESRDGPVHEVALSPFFLSKYEMTQAQWARFAGDNPSWKGSPLDPVEQVSWDDCAQVLPRCFLRLPSDAEWEYGARGGTDTPWWTGRERESLRGKINLADQAAWRSGNSWQDALDWPELDDGYVHHAPVDTFGPNPFGLYNVHGNVNEWCQDGYSLVGHVLLPRIDPVAPTAPSTSRVVRGGGYQLCARWCRSSTRLDASPVQRAIHLGVRPARTLTGRVERSR